MVEVRHGEKLRSLFKSEVNTDVCTKLECQRHLGKHVQFYTPWGYHQGILERMNRNSVTVLSPRKYIPTHLASAQISEDEAKKLDVSLAAWGGYGAGNAVGGYGGYGGRGGYGGWGYGWGRWAVSFLVIYALFGLWW